MLTFLTIGTHIITLSRPFYDLGLWLPTSGTPVERGHSRSWSPDRSWRHRDRSRYNDHEWRDDDRAYRHIPRSRDVDVEPLNAKTRPKDALFRLREEVEPSEDSERGVRHRSSSLRPGTEERYRVSSPLVPLPGDLPHKSWHLRRTITSHERRASANAATATAACPRLYVLPPSSPDTILISEDVILGCYCNIHRIARATTSMIIPFRIITYGGGECLALVVRHRHRHVRRPPIRGCRMKLGVLLSGTGDTLVPGPEAGAGVWRRARASAQRRRKGEKVCHLGRVARSVNTNVRKSARTRIRTRKRGGVSLPGKRSKSGSYYLESVG